MASLIKAPPGKAPGKPSRALTAAQGMAVLAAAAKDRLHAYFVLSLLIGVRTEEARALRWDHVDLDGDLAARSAVSDLLTRHGMRWSQAEAISRKLAFDPA